LSIERLITTVFVAVVRFFTRMYPAVDPQTVRGYKRLIAAFIVALIVVLALVDAYVSTEVRHGAVRPFTAVVITLETLLVVRHYGVSCHGYTRCIVTKPLVNDNISPAQRAQTKENSVITSFKT
jgi:branched-subunit amino acid transport protein AzlD